MSDLETAMALFIGVFDHFACSEGKKDTLSKGEFKALLEKELPGLMKNAKGKDECGQLLKDLDENKDNEVDFKEFLIFIAALTYLGHERFQQTCKK
ncbi:protein S100-P-like [Bufo gargarizans]|uniref:protein S100-P-like n=1 Tax=Bufo gargarizans TaxID=30331 RepID=UPI001CF4DF85|nr:protein S100-P-like [Bufo gargarizans]